MYKIQFYIGVGGFSPEDLAARRNLAEVSLIARYGGLTATEGQGAWTAPDKQVVREPCLIYTVIEMTGKWGDEVWLPACEIAERLREIFDQDEVLITVDPLQIGSVKRRNSQP